ncbi:unnamed protein product [Ranitomeya imitator]|uniref:Large ribosomal subunit protein bL34m n=1 Tax=Ranitomeya imitator TaxID=111125 RepID=A0ABN9KR94_9NEOB|nr:unnamed protein product [Ranitomeya imitator]
MTTSAPELHTKRLHTPAALKTTTPTNQRAVRPDGWSVFASHGAGGDRRHGGVGSSWQYRTYVSVFRSFNHTELPSPGCGILSRTLPPNWSLLPVRTKKRGMEYQPKFLKRQRTHGWIKRTSTRGGIEVILRRMLKGRKSLTV